MTDEEEQEVDRAFRLAFGEWKPQPPPQPQPQPQLKSKPASVRWGYALAVLAIFAIFAYTFFHKPTQEENEAALLEAMAGADCDKLPTTMGVLFCRWDAHKLTHMRKP
jgi:hypothetical protein